jgi:hypothetical protein
MTLPIDLVKQDVHAEVGTHCIANGDGGALHAMLGGIGAHASFTLGQHKLITNLSASIPVLVPLAQPLVHAGSMPVRYAVSLLQGLIKCWGATQGLCSRRVGTNLNHRTLVSRQCLMVCHSVLEQAVVKFEGPEAFTALEGSIGTGGEGSL